MKKKVHYTKRSVVQPKDTLSTGTFGVYWFVGHFLEHTDDLRAIPLIEVKWSVYHAGEKKPLWGFSRTATTLCMLIKGKITIWFPMTECILSHEGDYVNWPAGIPHRWMITEEALVLTIRWPSAAEDYCEQV